MQRCSERALSITSLGRYQRSNPQSLADGWNHQVVPAEAEKQWCQCPFPRQLNSWILLIQKLLGTGRGSSKTFHWTSALPGWGFLLKVEEEPNPISCPENCARGLAPGQNKALICSNHSFPTLSTFSAPSKHGLGHPPAQKPPVEQSSAELSRHHPLTPSICPGTGVKGGICSQLSLQSDLGQPLFRALFDLPVMVSDWEQAGQHPGLRGPILALPVLVSQGLGAGASPCIPTGSCLAASQSEDSPQQLSSLMGGPGHLSMRPHVTRKDKNHHSLPSNLG